VFPGGSECHEVFQGAYTAGDRAPLLRRPIIFGLCSELQAQSGGHVGRCSSIQERGETNGLPRLVNVLCEVGEKAVSG
jgi:hypothetical protein